MIPKFLRPEVLPYADILLVGLPTHARPQKLICAWCQDTMRYGTLPASHGICDACQAKLAPEANVREVFCRTCRQWFRVLEDHDACPRCQPTEVRA